MKITVLLGALLGGVVTLTTAAPQVPAGSKAEIGARTPVGDAVATACEECSKRYKYCVDMAFVPGLTNCERICKDRVMGADNACKSCDGSFYPGFARVAPPIKYERT